jgi:hypothetical protein
VKRLLVFAALVAVLALSVSLGGPATAFAIPSCQDLDGDPCSPNGAQTSCATVDGLKFTCTCRFGQWMCPY